MRWLRKELWTPLAALCLALVLSAGIASTTKALIAWQRAQVPLSPDTVLGINYYASYLTIVSVDASARTLLARVKNTASGQEMFVLYTFSDDFQVSRRDAIVRDGITIGVTPATRAELKDLTMGQMALGAVQLENGRIVLHRLVLGTPFPRP